MAEITVELIKTLREKTNAGMMDCKAALKETDGDLEAAETVLRKKNLSAADKKAGRAAKEGVIASKVSDDKKTGIIVEVNCETDFVAKNDNFRDFVDQVVGHVYEADKTDSVEATLDQKFVEDDSITLGEFVKNKAGELGENMGLTRCTKYEAGENGTIATYIHMQGKVGVLVEVSGGNGSDALDEVIKDLTLHIAAAQPVCITRDEVPAKMVAAEEDIFREQMKDKPADKIEMILKGKMNKFYSTNCLLEQGFVKDPDKSISDLLKTVGDDVQIVRFERYAVGESSED